MVRSAEEQLTKTIDKRMQLLEKGLNQRLVEMEQRLCAIMTSAAMQQQQQQSQMTVMMEQSQQTVNLCSKQQEELRELREQNQELLLMGRALEKQQQLTEEPLEQRTEGANSETNPSNETKIHPAENEQNEDSSGDGSSS